MKSVFRIACTIVLVISATLVIPACSKHAPAVEQVSPTPKSAENDTKKIIVAKVNDKELTMDELLKMMNTLPAKSPGSPPETVEEHKQRALDSLVLLELAYQRAHARGLNAGPDNIAIGLDNLKNSLGGEKEYKEFLTSQNMTEEELRSQIERRLTIERIYTEEVVNKVSIPEENLKQEFEKDKQQLKQPEKVSVIDVYLLKDEGKASQKKAQELIKKIKADPKQDPMKLILDGTFMVRRLVVRPDKNKELYDAARKLKAQELSGVIKTPTGIHVIKLDSYSPERPLTFEEAKPLLETKLKGTVQEKLTHEWERDLKKDAKIVLLDKPVQEEKKDQQKP